MIENIKKICAIKQNVNLKTMCSIKIGGIAECVAYPKNISELKKLIIFLEDSKIKYYILGNGTNVVFEDGVLDGVLICLKMLNNVKIKDNIVTTLAGVNLFMLNNFCANNNLSGLEFSYGIPGTVGGACVMNAGAYNGEMCDVIKCVTFLEDGKIKKWSNKKCKFSYRASIFKNSNKIVLKVEFLLKNDKKEHILLKMQDILSKRLASQPYGTLNCGSVFKKCKNESAGKTIDKLGLKNVKIGQMQISGKHANFFVNLGGATSSDMHNLVDFVKQKVQNSLNISLNEEVIFIGRRK